MLDGLILMFPPGIYCSHDVRMITLKERTVNDIKCLCGLVLTHYSYSSNLWSTESTMQVALQIIKDFRLKI